MQSVVYAERRICIMTMLSVVIVSVIMFSFVAMVGVVMLRVMAPIKAPTHTKKEKS
jgi:hypothetical protein